ncbi:class I SAM-dependent methyltransferase [Streptomyces sp. ICN441]|uniref:Class I SAM-dependent methyltransferase n=1 Tax=Streptomyces tirandamycinicus TaxID=2174846 RepID=A0A2S1T2B8_9ACTN|nr:MULTISPECIES: class I SAM-dependent methyltransferase [Streptomyces]AWI32791.1 class I SAM-dependent methyltransferase [Streptomyces tirandamycinicus]TFE38837.1 class I SAM-dependent methyltransferase [Streptomyces sp. ICN441]
MNVSTAPVAAGLTGAFLGAAPDDLAGEFRTLVDALWDAGEAKAGALAAVPDLVSALAEADPGRKGHLAVLLGLLAETEYPDPDGPLTRAVRGHLGTYLELLGTPGGGTPLTLALLYLLAHFPGDRNRILAAASAREPEPEDLSRLDRALATLDLDAPDLGRVWPSPSAWTLNEDERAFDQGWIKELTPEQLTANWENDTRTVLGCTGARAYWAVCNGDPRNLPTAPVPERREVTAPVADATLFAPHLDALRCPSCKSPLASHDGTARCGTCRARYPVAGGILDLTATAAEGDGDAAADFLEKLSRVPSMGLFYEAVARPAFLRVSGSDWGGEVTPADEDRYIAEHVRPVDGPVLDLGAGAGRWTAVIADTVGAERLIALDSALPMLNVLRGRLPEVPSVLASAAELPFHDAALGAVVCWNALQAFYADAGAAIAEVGRVLRPGGTFTLMTFRRSDDPVYRYFQSAHRFPQHQGGLQLFDRDDLKRWLADAGLTVREESGPGTFVFLTAVREH